MHHIDTAKTYREKIKPYMRNTAREGKTNSLVTFSYVPFYMDVTVLADQQELTAALCG